MLDKTPLEMALEREGQIEYCDECEYVRVVDNTVFCGLSGKLLHPMMFHSITLFYIQTYGSS